jgi:hypothetical protein
MAQDKQKKSDWWYLPPDWAFFFGIYFIMMPILILSGCLLPYLSLAKSRGDVTLLYIALALGGVGTVLLFFARLPLYRQRRFFTFGSRALDEHHRRLYRWAYRFIGGSVLLLLILWAIVR